MSQTTPIHTNCGTCTECAQNPQIVKYKCKKGGSYELINGYVCEGKDCRGEQKTNTISTIIKCVIVGQVVGIAAFLITGDATIGAVVCFGASILCLFIG
jgi:hypothetical protein